MKLLNIYSLGLGVLLLGLVPTSAMAVQIDLFNSVDNDVNDLDDDEFSQVVIRDRNNTSLLNNTDSGLTDVIGGYRTIGLEITEQNDASRRDTSELYVDTEIKKIVLANTDSFTPSTSITWDGENGSLGGVNLTDGGDNSFLLDVETDLAVTFTFNVEDTSSNTGSVSQNVTSDGQYYFSYNDPGVSAVDFSSIKSISLATDNEPAGLDYSYNLVETAVEPVPFEFSPSLGIILCGGLFGIHKLRKRLQSN